MTPIPRREKKDSPSTSQDIFRPPKSLSSSEEDDDADIKPQLFERKIMKRDQKAQKIDRNTRSNTEKKPYTGVNGYRSMRGLDLPASSERPHSRNRRNTGVGESSRLRGATEIFGKCRFKKKNQAVYGSSSQSTVSSQSASSSQSSQSSLPKSSQTCHSSPRKRLKSVKLYDSDSSYPELQESPPKRFKTINIGLSESDGSEDEVSKSFKNPNQEFLDLVHPETPEKSFINPGRLLEDGCVSSSSFNNFDLHSPTLGAKSSQSLNLKAKIVYKNLPTSTGGSPNVSLVELPEITERIAKRLSPKKDSPFNTDSDLELNDKLKVSNRGKIRSAKAKAKAKIKAKTTKTKTRVDRNSELETDLTSDSISRCPMCNLPVSSDDLRKHGYMNTRKQEKFCLSHRKKTAKQEWENNRYPDIDWSKLDSRISKHHEFLKGLINGEDSHYRDALKEKVDEGKDRNLRTMTSNLIPGYYGPRGLRIISENIFRQFTPLLKRRIVQDRLIAARGYTPYVQSVIVPEVASLLIQEDLRVTLQEARKILTRSAAVGELLHEEIKDIVPNYTDDHRVSDDAYESG